ncbi:acetyltransferase [Allosphingosinicella sp.]|uniref:acetyltransferase n=1 Tax=Allosphingosinicella sp. TaxID=2823234 RepID=UPI002EFC3039
MTTRLILFGSGGHAKVVLEALQAERPGVEVAILDDDPAAASRSLLGHPVRGDRSWLEREWPRVRVIPAIGSNSARAELVERLRESGRELETVVHPAATVSPSALLGPGCFVAAGAVVNAEAVLEAGVIVNTGASVDHDCRIGLAAHIAPGARLCGQVKVGARSLVGTCSAVIPKIRIGSDAVIGAGSAVIADVPDGGRVAGSPARPI